jgi:hypothetical protein
MVGERPPLLWARLSLVANPSGALLALGVYVAVSRI